MYFGTPLYWRETHKQPRFLIFDGRLVFLILIVLMHLRLWTVILAATCMIVLFLFDRKGVPADSILRYIRSRIVGVKRTARGIHAERYPVDFGFETRSFVKEKNRRHALAAEAFSNAAPHRLKSKKKNTGAKHG